MESKRDKKIQDLEDELEELKRELDISKKKKNTGQKRKTPSKILYQWKAPSRVFRKWEKEKLFTVFLWLLVIIVLLLFVKQYITIFVIFALGFVIYAMTNFPPEIVEHILTDEFFIWFEKEYEFDDLKEFWFSKRGNQIILNVETNYRIPARLIYLVDEKEEKDLYNILQEYLPYKQFEKKQNFFSILVDGSYINMDGESASVA